ncbi:MAG: NAD-dependent epimerase/dehydratase family protein [Chloroflexota bacterium]
MILVTGSTGFIGQTLSRALAESGHEWRAYSGRMNAPQTLRIELEGIDTVIHLAGIEARGRSRMLQHVDVEGTQRLIEECRRAGVGRLIVPSRLNADPYAMQRLLRAKGEVERLVQHSGIPYTILRSATLYGRNDRFSEIILSLALWSWPLVWLPGGGRVAMQPLWVDDFARCLVNALDRTDLTNQIVTLAGQERFTYQQIVRVILENRGLKRLMFPIPGALVRPITTMTFGWWYWPPVSRFMVDRFFVPEVADLDSIYRQFNFAPARFGDTISYLNRRGLPARLFRH